jgi:sn-glycerol 3-phosphate transport system permease protein
VRGRDVPLSPVLYGRTERACEASKLDGATSMQFFRYILLPFSRTNIAARGVIMFIYGWNQFL